MLFIRYTFHFNYQDGEARFELDGGRWLGQEGVRLDVQHPGHYQEPSQEHRGGHSGSQAAAALRAPRHEALSFRTTRTARRITSRRGSRPRRSWRIRCQRGVTAPSWAASILSTTGSSSGWRLAKTRFRKRARGWCPTHSESVTGVVRHTYIW